MSLAGAEIEFHVGITGHEKYWYDRAGMRKVLAGGGSIIRREARRLVSHRGRSIPGNNPGMQTGRLRRAIGMVSKGSGGGWLKIGVRTIPDSIFYPAFLYYGSPSTGLEKRNNFMVEALQNKKDLIRVKARIAMKNALVPKGWT